MRWVSNAVVRAPYERVAAAVTGDAKTWDWFPMYRNGATEGDRRWIHIGTFMFNETILERSDSVLRFRVDESNAPFAKALVEDWRAEPHPDGAVVTWTFAADPRPMLRIPGSRQIVRMMFRRAMRRLEARLA